MLYFDSLPDFILERQERICALFNGETPERPLAYLCPMGYTRFNGVDPLDFDRAKWDLSYVADFKETGISGLLTEDNDNTPLIGSTVGGFHFIDSLFGIEPIVRKSVIWGDPLDWDLEMGKLPDYDAYGGLMGSALKEIEFMQSKFGKLPVTPPNICGPLNAALNVFGNERFLRFSRVDPNAAQKVVEHMARVISEVNRIVKEAVGDNFISSIPKFWVPPEIVMMPWCATQLISEDTYHNVVQSADEYVIQGFSGGIFHICGRSTHLIEVLREMRSIRGIEISGSPAAYLASKDFQMYFNGLRDDQVIIVSVNGIKPYEILEISGGERTILFFTDPLALRRFNDEYR